MRKEVILITGAAGEIGQALIYHLSEAGHDNLLAMDVKPIPEPLVKRCREAMIGDILDKKLQDRLIAQYAMPTIYHLAALLSTRAEFTPEAAHRVNVDGTLLLLQMAADQSAWLGKPVKFIFPSSVAIYGMPDLDTKIHVGAVRENEWNTPITMYGWNKLYCEGLGHYYSHHYQQLSEQPQFHKIDFRSLRFPGLISAFTLPTGGTSDYGPEMIHHAAQGISYPCFVREDTRMPFMAMPDAIKALLELAAAPRENLKTHVYNVTAFNPSAGEIFDLVRQHFPDAAVSFEPDTKRQQIVDSWPADQNDNRARHDWGWLPDYDLERAFAEYLVPNIKKRYQS